MGNHWMPVGLKVPDAGCSLCLCMGKACLCEPEELAFSSFGVLLKEKISREYLLIYLVTKAVEVPGIRLGVLKWKGLDRNVLSVSETQGYVKTICTEQGVSGFRKSCCLALQSA